MLFAPRNASVIEFPLNPHHNRCFGFMAMALDLDYWVVPQVSTSYMQHYTMTDDRAEHVVTLVQHLIETKGLTHILRKDAPAETVRRAFEDLVGRHQLYIAFTNVSVRRGRSWSATRFALPKNGLPWRNGACRVRRLSSAAVGVHLACASMDPSESQIHRGRGEA